LFCAASSPVACAASLDRALLRVDGFDLEIVVVGEIDQKLVRKWFDVVEAGVDHDALVAGQRAAWTHVGGLLHAVVGAKRRHDAAQTVGPVAGAEFLAVPRDADDDKAINLFGHVFVFSRDRARAAAPPESATAEALYGLWRTSRDRAGF
jgi:hypothetical protein